MKGRTYELSQHDALPICETDVLNEHLKLLTKLIEFSRETYIPILIDRLLPFIQSLSNDHLQAVLLNYLSGICYLGLSITYPITESNEQPNDEHGENFIEGYGVTNYVKSEDDPINNPCCTMIKNRRKAETQPCYYCFTCNLIENKACCTVCAKVCHKGHKISFVKYAQINCYC